MDSITPPLLTLADDCLVLIAEAVAALDLKLPKECVAGSKSSAMRTKPTSLLNFSMVNKNVLRMISGVVFRNAFLVLDEHYQSDFRRGKDVTPWALPSGDIVHGIGFPKDLIGHTRTLSLQCREYFSGFDLSINDGEPTDSSHTTLTSLGLLSLLRTPRALKRLSIDKLPQCLLNDMRGDATVIGMQPFVHVQELAICITAGFFIPLCPSTVTLYVTEANWLEYTSFFPGDDDNLVYWDEFCRFSSALTRLRSLQVGSRIQRMRLSDLHANFSQLEHLYLEEGHGLMRVWPPTDVATIITAGFPRLRTFTVRDILEYKMVLRDGRDLWEEVRQQRRSRLTREHKELLSFARFELAEDLLYSGHPTLEAVYMPVRARSRTPKPWLPEGHQKFVRCGGQRGVKVESFEIKPFISTLHWQWQPAITN